MNKPVLNRRQLLLAATAAGLMPSFPAHTLEKARVIVIGGGMAGATLAKYLRKWGPNLQVTLIDRNARYTSCIMSSLVLSGQRKLSSLQYDYAALKQKYGVTVRTDEVLAVDPVARSVTLGSGKVLRAERIVLAPGVEFDPVPGLSNPDAMPHAWKAGPQTTLLRQQLLAMQPGGTVVLTIPKVPYRCPPGPYERACLLADWLKTKKPGSRLLVLDANADFVTEKDNFSSAFFDLHGDVIEYRTNTEVLSADAATMTLQTSTGPVQGQVINLIPRQRCGSIVTSAGLANATEGRFAGVNVLNYESTAAAGIHVIGDSSATTQPKAGHIANQEAKVCADAIVRAFAGEQPDPAPVTNSACFSTITMSKASWLHAGFQYNPATGQMTGVPNASGASIGWNADNFDQMNDWFRALMADTFA
ncbi:MAG: FAD-dependent oxidoreductase [Burkholderiales bacterium]|nr:FAD-dependent oxidoreductase [Burkholderiales bacterium]